MEEPEGVPAQQPGGEPFGGPQPAQKRLAYDSERLTALTSTVTKLTGDVAGLKLRHQLLVWGVVAAVIVAVLGGILNLVLHARVTNLTNDLKGMQATESQITATEDSQLHALCVAVLDSRTAIVAPTVAAQRALRDLRARCAGAN